MDQESSLHSGRVSVTMDLDSEVVDWLDALSEHLGIRSRGVLVSNLLRELMHDASVESPASES